LNTCKDDDIITKAIAANKKIQSRESEPVNLSAFRGNLFKQTLGPEWDRPKIPEDYDRKGSVTQLDNILSKTAQTPTNGKPAFDASSSLTGVQRGSFRKTVTNFKSVKYDDNGGLNPQSPYKRGMPK